jgi:glutathione peroxidase-family protein
MSLPSLDLIRIDGSHENLGEYEGRVLLIVNMASLVHRNQVRTRILGGG